MELLSKIEQWAEDRNLIKGATAIDQFAKMVSEVGELADALLKNQDDLAKDALGDVVVVLTVIARQKGWHLADCIQGSYNEIKDRKGIMYNGSFIKESDPRYAELMVELGR
jgi:NTP pyrophosphatase (non-canonical NTP hydrolase)